MVKIYAVGNEEQRDDALNTGVDGFLEYPTRRTLSSLCRGRRGVTIVGYVSDAARKIVGYSHPVCQLYFCGDASEALKQLGEFEAPNPDTIFIGANPENLRLVGVLKQRLCVQ